MNIAKDAEKQRQLSQTIEDKLINQFIENDLPAWDPKGPSNQTLEYTNLDPNNKMKAEIEAFKYFMEGKKQKTVDNPKYTNLSFENYLKLARPEDGFRENLHKTAEIGTPDPAARLWHEVFAENTGVMKHAAIEGYKRILANQSDRDRKAVLNS